MAGDEASALYGAWESTEAFGNTALDWSQVLKQQQVELAVAFAPLHSEYAFQLFTQDAATGERADVTKTFRHVVAAKGKYALQGAKRLLLEGDSSRIQWMYQREEGDTLRLRLEGAKRFGRCKGVDVIYFKRVATPWCLSKIYMSKTSSSQSSNSSDTGAVALCCGAGVDADNAAAAGEEAAVCAEDASVVLLSWSSESSSLSALDAAGAAAGADDDEEDAAPAAAVAAALSS